MKKTHLAWIVLTALSTHAFAQSSITLSGLLDIGYSVGNGGIYEGSSGIDSKFQQWGNGRSSSNWGINGTEHLGNGNKIYFQLDQDFNPQNGQDVGGAGFNNAAYLGGSGRWGALQAGLQSTVSSNIMTDFDISGTPNLTSSLGNAGISGDVQRLGTDVYSTASSSLVYISPEFSGFQFQTGIILKNNDAFDFGSEGKNIYTLGFLYNYTSKLTLGASFESKPAETISGEKVSASWGLGATYDFGSFEIAGSYFDNHLKSDGRGFSFGISMPWNAFEFGTQVAYNTKAYIVDDGSERKVKPFAWEMYMLYNLSKRTQLYAQYGGMNNDGKRYNDANRSYSAGLGVIHNF